MYALRGEVTGEFVDPENGETRFGEIPWNDELTEGALFRFQWQAIQFIAERQDRSPAVEIVKVESVPGLYRVVGTI